MLSYFCLSIGHCYSRLEPAQDQGDAAHVARSWRNPAGCLFTSSYLFETAAGIALLVLGLLGVLGQLDLVSSSISYAFLGAGGALTLHALAYWTYAVVRCCKGAPPPLQEKPPEPKGD